MRNVCPDVEYISFLAMRSGEIIMRYFQTDNHVEWKEDGSPVMHADKKISELVISHFARDFPHISIVTEEGSNIVPDAEYIGLCDPLDGTIAYRAGVPFATFSFVLLRNLEPIIAVIYDPFLKRMWIGIKDEVSTMNGKPIRVSQRRELKRANLCILYWPGAFESFSLLTQRAQKLDAYCINPAAVSYFGGLLSSGQYDGIMFPGENYWEAIAIDLIVHGAGGKTTDALGNKIVYNPGKKMYGMFSSNGYLHDELFRLFL